MEQIITNQNDILKVQAELLKIVSDLEKSKYICTIKKLTKKRSINANDYMWKLLDELGKKLRTTKEELYKKYIKDYGVWDTCLTTNDAVKTFIAHWESRGLGWFCEVVDSKIKDCTKLYAYCGSSVYNSEEMNRVLNHVVEDCKEQKIETLDDLEIKRLIENYGGKNGTNNNNK